MKTIGGTAISAILGQNPWKSKFGVYQDLIGESEPVPDNDAMARGRRWEPALIGLHETQSGLDVFNRSMVSGHVLNHDVHEFLTGTPDMMYRLSDGEQFGLEVKTSDIMTRDKYDCKVGTIPAHYYYQCMWYCGLAGFNQWDFIVGFFRDDNFVSFETCSFDFDKELYDLMIEAAVEFWNNHVVPRIPPEITEPSEIIEVCRRQFPRHTDGKFIESDDETEKLAQGYLDAEITIRTGEEFRDTFKSQIIKKISDAEGVITSVGKFTFKANKDSERTDWEKVAYHMRNALARETDAETAERDLTTAIQTFTTIKPGPRVFRVPRWKDEK